MGKLSDIVRNPGVVSQYVRGMYITGNRGEAKKIVLDRRYVSWEAEDE